MSSKLQSRRRLGWQQTYTGGRLAKLPWYGTLGNHDCAGDTDAQYNFAHPRWRVEPFATFERLIPTVMGGESGGEAVVRVVILDACTLVCGKHGPMNYRCAGSVGIHTTPTISCTGCTHRLFTAPAPQMHSQCLPGIVQ